jgi:ketosteroid isomerase-like protein
LGARLSGTRRDDSREMNVEPAKRFVEYAAAFERTFVDDDWARLEACFAEDAIYVVTGEAPLGGRWEGRKQLLEQLRKSVNELDRKFDERRVELLGTPTIGDDSFEVRWRGTYTKAGCPDLVLEGTERATFEGNRIRLLEDLIEEGVDRRIQEYVARYLG